MQGFVEFLKGWQLHPVVDHFTVALVLVAILVDLVASLVPSRLWLRYMALTLMVLGALAAFGSNETGGWEAERVWDHIVNGPAKDLLRTHAEWGGILPYVFGALALWRVGVEFVGFLSRTRLVYLLAAVAAGGAILYQGDMGGDLVYEYGVGTAPAMIETPTPTASPSTTQQPAAIPTVYAPPITSTPPSLTPTPTATMSSSSGTAVNPPPSPAAPSIQPSPPAAKSTTL